MSTRRQLSDAAERAHGIDSSRRPESTPSRHTATATVVEAAAIEFPEFDDQVSYIDTIVVLFPNGTSAGFLGALNDTVLVTGGKTRMIVREIPERGWAGWRAKIHQPTRSTFRVLAGCEDKYRITQVHVALDLLTNTMEQAQDLQTFVASRLVPPGRARRAMCFFDSAWAKLKASDPARAARLARVPRPRYVLLDECDGPLPPETIYFNRVPGLRGIEIALYCDKPSKTALLSPCLHIEWRIKGIDALKKCRLDRIDRIESLDHVAFWDGQLSLYEPPTRSQLAMWLQRAELRRRSPKEPIDKYLREARRLLRMTSLGDADYGATHDILMLLSSHQRKVAAPRRTLLRLSHRSLLPRSVLNALWTRNRLPFF